MATTKRLQKGEKAQAKAQGMPMAVKPPKAPKMPSMAKPKATTKGKC